MDKNKLNIISTNEATLNFLAMPERRNLDDLQNAVDVLIGEGLLKIRGIMNAEETPAREAISAINTVVTIGKYIHTRKTDEIHTDMIIEIDDELRI